jgi:hypothetical protein
MTKSTATPQTIVIVPGHDILVDATLALVDKGWVAGFPGEAVARMLHIWVAIAYATAQRNAIVVFSGGVTKLQTTLSEAQSYLDGAKYCGWIVPDVVGWLLEEFALDSPTNIVFSLGRFYQEFSCFPSRVVVSGFEFKRRRYCLHWAALVARCPLLKDVEFIYLGASNPGVVPLLATNLKTAPEMEAMPADLALLNATLTKSINDEAELVREMIRLDDCCLTGRSAIPPSSPRYDFITKRRERNVMNRRHPYNGVPDLIGLEPDGFYNGL